MGARADLLSVIAGEQSEDSQVDTVGRKLPVTAVTQAGFGPGKSAFRRFSHPIQSIARLFRSHLGAARSTETARHVLTETCDAGFVRGLYFDIEIKQASHLFFRPDIHVGIARSVAHEKREHLACGLIGVKHRKRGLLPKTSAELIHPEIAGHRWII